MVGIILKYKELCEKPSDINEHLPVLFQYSKECETITELGVRWVVSTWAFLASKPKKLTSIDLYNPSHYGGNLDEVYNAVKGTNIEFVFIESDDLKIELEQTDLLFIDTLHTYKQLKQELALHSHKVNKYIIMHDIFTFGEVGMDGGQGMLKAIYEFLKYNDSWKIKDSYFKNNGLMILERVK